MSGTRKYKHVQVCCIKTGSESVDAKDLWPLEVIVALTQLWQEGRIKVTGLSFPFKSEVSKLVLIAV